MEGTKWGDEDDDLTFVEDIQKNLQVKVTKCEEAELVCPAST